MVAIVEAEEGAGRAPAEGGFKAYRRGTHRTVEPAATLARVQPLLAGMGITRVANVTGLDRIGVPVVMVCRPNARSLAVSQGKGLTLEAAKASGVMEALELWHAERIEAPLRLGSARELRRAHRLIEVDALPRREGSRFHDDLPILWIEGRDLLGDGALWVPFEVVHTNYTLPLPTGSGCFAASSNGLASGNHALEATCHGIAEVVERDAVALWNHLEPARRGRTRLDPESVDDADCVMVWRRLEEAGFEVAVWDVTSDVGIAAFYCLIVDRRRTGAHSGAGAGSHPARAVALLRALTEAIQVRTTYIAGSRDDLRPDEFGPAAIEQKLRRARALMNEAGARRDFRAVPTYEAASCGEDLAWMLERLRAVGIRDVVALDLSRAELGVPVVRVVIPGLEGPDDHEGHVPGRRLRQLLEGRR